MIISNLEVQNQFKVTYATSGILQTDSTGLVSVTTLNSTSSTWSPVFTNQSGISALTSDSAYYLKTGNIVNFGCSLSITTLGLSPSFDISLPIDPTNNFTGNNQVVVSCNVIGSTFVSIGSDAAIRSLATTKTLRVSFPSLSIGSWVLRIQGIYNIA